MNSTSVSTVSNPEKMKAKENNCSIMAAISATISLSTACEKGR